ncbi:hypothetical protein GCM10009109_00610 [Marinobacterium sediminicola]
MLACRGDIQLLAHILEKRLAKGMLQLSNLRADGRLGQAKLVSRAAITQVLAHGMEYLELTKREACQ